jgi:hypothetical protein
MRQTLHIFRKDIRYLRMEICLVAALAGVFAWKGGQQWTEILFALAATYLIARLIHAEPIPGDRQFWITRPYQWKCLLAAKILFILAFVNLPTLLAQLYILIDAKFSIAANWPGLLWSQLLNILVIWLAIAALASVTESILSFNFAAFILVTVAFLFQQSTIRDLTDVKWPVGFEWIRNSVGVAVVVAITSCVLYVQYKKRLTRFSRVFAIFALTIVLGATALYLPPTWAMAVQSRLSARRIDSSSLQFALASNAERHFPPHRANETSADLPLVVNGVPGGVDIEVDAVRLEFQSPDGRTTRVNTAGANRQSAAPGVAVFDTPFMLPASFFNAERGQAGTLRAALYITLFGNPRSKTIRLQGQPVDVMDGLRCSLGIFNRFACEAPFRWPDRLVYVQTGGALSSLGYLTSYSPFPSGVNLDDAIETRWTTDVSPFASEATVTVKEPIGHFRRAIEFDNVRLDDLAAPTRP